MIGAVAQVLNLVAILRGTATVMMNVLGIFSVELTIVINISIHLLTAAMTPHQVRIDDK